MKFGNRDGILLKYWVKGRIVEYLPFIHLYLALEEPYRGLEAP